MDTNLIAQLEALLAVENATPPIPALARQLLQQAHVCLKESMKPEWYNDWHDPEYGSYDSVDMAGEDLEDHEVRRVTGSRQVVEGWVARRCVTVDDDGEPDETEAVLFLTEAEATSCWSTSLAEAQEKAKRATTP